MNILQTVNVIFNRKIKYPLIEIEEKKVTFLRGDSGSGKTTLLRLFNATISPDSGEILYCGVDVNTMDTVALRREVLLAGQTAYLFRGTIAHNFQQYYGYRELPPLSEGEMKGYLSLCCVDFLPDASCDTMSGGERQRIYIAICLSLSPKLLMLDEPTSALDEKTADAVLSNLIAFCREKGTTLIIVSHDGALVEKYAESVIYLERQV